MKKILIGLLFMLMVIQFTGCMEAPTYRYDLIALENKAEANISGGGIFFIWSITEGKEIYYYSYVRDSEDGIKLIKIHNNNAKFYEDVTDGNSYAISDCKDTNYYPENNDWDFHVPPNTIRNYINIDMSNVTKP